MVFCFRAYNSSRLYRELKLRGAILKNGRLSLLMFEKMYSTVNGVWNLSSEQVLHVIQIHFFLHTDIYSYYSTYIMKLVIKIFCLPIREI